MAKKFAHKFIATVDERGISFENPAYVKKLLLPLVGRKVSLTIEQIRAKRSLAQNALWHGPWLDIITSELGYFSKEECEADIKRHLGYVRKTEDKINGGYRERVESTADMNVAEMAEFLSKVQTFCAAELNIQLPSREQAEYV